MAARRADVQPTQDVVADVMEPFKALSKATASSASSASATVRSGKAEARVFNSIDKTKPSATLAWEGLGFSVLAKGERKDILRSISGDLRPGDLTCILGPSGSGKTSLLNILAGRVRSGGRSKAEIPGCVRVNGMAIEPSANQQLFGYVMQDDALLGTMTPREVLRFSARLRLEATSKETRESLVADLLGSMGLSKCAGTMVGNELIKGISGGERKRTAVGAELITNPQITFLDEPTSGLDTGAAYDVVSLLRQLTRMNRSVLCTIHQPSSEIFQLFDQAIFLVGGEVAYHGPPAGIRSHFSSLGLPCPQDYNPADFVIFSVTTEDESQVRAVVDGWGAVAAERPALPCTEGLDLPEAPRRKGFSMELLALVAREARGVMRDRSTLQARFGSAIFLSIIFGLVFFQVGSLDPADSALVDRAAYDMQSHAGALTMVGINIMFMSAMPLLLTFASERPVFVREYACSMYGAVPYFLSKTVIEVPLLLAQMTVQWLISYWLMGLHGNFAVHLCGTFLIGLAASSAALLAACLVKDAKQAIEAMPGLFVPQILFAGFFIKMDMIPVWFRWLQYLCALKWGMNILLHNEFEDLPGGQHLLRVNDVHEDDMWINFVVLLCITIGFRTLAALALTGKARAFYN